MALDIENNNHDYVHVSTKGWDIVLGVCAAHDQRRVAGNCVARRLQKSRQRKSTEFRNHTQTTTKTKHAGANTTHGKEREKEKK